MNETASQTKSQSQTNPLLASSVLQRKCACGSHTVAGGECAECAKNIYGLQRKLTIGASNDPLEQEADRIADQVMAKPTHSGISGASPRIRRYSGQTTEGMNTAPASVDRVLASSGRPLEPALRQDMERRFGHDFSQVRVHSGATAEQSARDVNARAYTVRNNVVFGVGRFAPGTQEGRRLIAHELAHVVQQSDLRQIGSQERKEKQGLSSTPLPHRSLLQRQPARQTLRDQICYQPGTTPTGRQPLDCDAREPENCPTYEQWLNSFRRLSTFAARDTAPGGRQESGFDVLGHRAARPVDNPSALTNELPVQVKRSTIADRFIDHPTEQWVSTCLPENLRETAYSLPSDCADIAVILRHAWLSAHHRTETYRGWTVGDQQARTRREQVGQIIGEVYTGNVARMINAYSDPSGQPLRAFSDLMDLLHPGDILVWEHHSAGLGTARTGGHTHTIVSLTRSNGRITQIRVLQGNQPIFQPQAQEIRQHIGGGAPSEGALGDAPGRRIETDTLSGSDLQDLDLPIRRGRVARVWVWNDGHTTLTAAGPPAAAPRPATRRIQGQRIRRISDWFSPLRSAERERLHGVFEAALLETRSMVEGGQTGLDSNAQTLGETAGKRLWDIARQAGQSREGDLADESHFRPLRRMRATIQALGDPGGQRGFSSTSSASAADVQRVFDLIDAAFHVSARGASSISFIRSMPRGATLVRVLITGFDPFVDASGLVPVGTVNPSGAAALAMDNTSVQTGQVTAAVEGVVLPVDFDDFRQGMVENIVRPLARNRGVDAVITISLDESLIPTGPVRIERFVVGVHNAGGRPGAIPAASSTDIGPAIIETPAPVEDIARETERPARRRAPGIPRPAIGTAVYFRFYTAAAADRALSALGLSPTGDRDVSIADVAALRKIIQTMRRSTNGVDITFQAGGQTFLTAVISGPGGNFLSNEVSFRVLRLLGEEGRMDIPSFHVHVQRPLPSEGERIPQDTSTRAARATRRRAISFAISVRDRLIATLQRMIRSVATRIAAKTNSSRSRTP